MDKPADRQIIVIAHNLRSTHNVGSLLRTADGLGISEVILTGYTPHAAVPGDTRLPHIAAKLAAQIHKTALGAESTLPWRYETDVFTIISQLKGNGWQIAALEQTDRSVILPDFMPPGNVAIIIGREVEGIEPELLTVADVTVEIPMFGRKESFNVVQAAAMALYHCRFVARSLPPS